MHVIRFTLPMAPSRMTTAQGSQEAIVNAPREAVNVDGITEVAVGVHIAVAQGGSGHPDLCRGVEVFEDLPPLAFVAGAAAVTFVYNDHVEEVGRIALVETWPAFAVGDGLIDGEVDLPTLDGPALDLVQRVAEGCEGAILGLIDQDVAVGQVQDSALATGLSQFPHDLHGDEGLAGAGGHGDQDAPFTLDDGLHRPVDGDFLVVAWALDCAVGVAQFAVSGKQQDFGVGIPGWPLVAAQSLPQFLGCGEGV